MVKMVENTVAELLREATAALDEQRVAGSETANNMPAPNHTVDGHANRVQWRFESLWGPKQKFLGGPSNQLSSPSCYKLSAPNSVL